MKSFIISVLLGIFLLSGIGFAYTPLVTAYQQDNAVQNVSLCSDDNTVGIRGNISAETNNPYESLLRWTSQEMTGGDPYTRWTTGEIWDLKDANKTKGETTFNVTYLVTTQNYASSINLGPDFTEVKADDNLWENTTNTTAYENGAYHCRNTEDCGQVPVIFAFPVSTYDIDGNAQYKLYVHGICHHAAGNEFNYTYNVSLDGATEIPCDVESASNTSWVWDYFGLVNISAGDNTFQATFLGGDGYESYIDAVKLINTGYAGTGAWWFSRNYDFTEGSGLFYENTLLGWDSRNKTGSQIDTDVGYIFADPEYNRNAGKCSVYCNDNVSASMIWLQIMFILLGIITAVFFISQGDPHLAIGATIVFTVFIVMCQIVLPLLNNVC